jgi:hypothetical protein
MTQQGLAGNLGGSIQFWSFQFNYLDLQGTTTASGVAYTFNLYNQLSGPPYNTSVAMTIPQGSFILYTRVKHSTPFTGGSLTGMTVSVGKLGAANNFFTQAFNVFQAVADGTLQETFAQPNGQLSTYTPTVTFTPTGDTLAHCTAGVLNIDVAIFPVTTPAQYVANNIVLNSSVL